MGDVSTLQRTITTSQWSHGFAPNNQYQPHYPLATPSVAPDTALAPTATDPTPEVVVNTRNAASMKMMCLGTYVGSPRDDEIVEVEQDLRRPYNQQTYNATLLLGKNNVATPDRLKGLSNLVKKRNKRKNGN